MIQVLLMPSPFAERLKKLREDADLTQEELAQRSKISIGTIRKLEQNDSDPKLSTLCALAKALGVTLAEFEPFCEDAIAESETRPKRKKK